MSLISYKPEPFLYQSVYVHGYLFIFILSWNAKFPFSYHNVSELIDSIEQLLLIDYTTPTTILLILNMASEIPYHIYCSLQRSC